MRIARRVRAPKLFHMEMTECLMTLPGRRLHCPLQRLLHTRIVDRRDCDVVPYGRRGPNLPPLGFRWFPGNARFGLCRSASSGVIMRIAGAGENGARCPSQYHGPQ